MELPKKHCTLLFLRRGDEVLLAMKKRGFGAGRYNGVGGKVEADETTEAALIRETQEEINVRPIHFWKVAEHDFIQNDESPWRMYVHAYLCDEWEGDPVETEEMTPEWFTVDSIPYDSMWQDDKLWLPAVLEGKHLYGHFTFDKNDNMLSHTLQETQFES